MKPQTQTAKHTPTPWKYHLGRGIDPRMHIQTIGGYQIAETPKNGISCGNAAINEANAEFICQAVNQHDQLVAQRDALLEVAKMIGELNAAHGIATNDAFTVLLDRLNRKATEANRRCLVKKGIG